jgi:hypothetical protein
MTRMDYQVWKVVYALLIPALFSQFHYAVAQKTVQQIIWNEPDGTLPDLTQTLTNGQTFGISWNAYNYTSYVDTTQNLVDLWVTGFEFNLNPFSQRLLGEQDNRRRI